MSVLALVEQALRNSHVGAAFGSKVHGNYVRVTNTGLALGPHSAARPGTAAHDSSRLSPSTPRSQALVALSEPPPPVSPVSWSLQQHRASSHSALYNMSEQATEQAAAICSNLQQSAGGKTMHEARRNKTDLFEEWTSAAAYCTHSGARGGFCLRLLLRTAPAACCCPLRVHAAAPAGGCRATKQITVSPGGSFRKTSSPLQIFEVSS